jgi:hypothetical protein
MLRLIDARPGGFIPPAARDRPRVLLEFSLIGTHPSVVVRPGQMLRTIWPGRFPGAPGSVDDSRLASASSSRSRSPFYVRVLVRLLGRSQLGTFLVHETHHVELTELGQVHTGCRCHRPCETSRGAGSGRRRVH